MDPMLVMAGRIKQLREERGWSKVELAGHAGISVPYMYDIEQGKRQPSPGVLAGLANALGASIDYLIGRTDVRVPPEAVEDLAPELARVWKNINSNPNMRLLYRTMHELSPEQIEALCRLVQSMTVTEAGGLENGAKTDSDSGTSGPTRNRKNK